MASEINIPATYTLELFDENFECKLEVVHSLEHGCPVVFGTNEYGRKFLVFVTINYTKYDKSSSPPKLAHDDTFRVNANVVNFVLKTRGGKFNAEEYKKNLKDLVQKFSSSGDFGDLDVYIGENFVPLGENFSVEQTRSDEGHPKFFVYQETIMINGSPLSWEY